MTIPTDVVDADLQEARDDLRLRLNQVINTFASRHDVLVDMCWDAAPGTFPASVPAWFDPARSLVTINGNIALAGAHPDDVDPTTPDGRREHPVLAGLCAHEGGHAHHTHWRTDVAADTPPALLRAASLLEEPRVEARQITRRPGDRLYLRAASRHLHLGARPAAASLTEDRWRAAQAALLTLGRRDAGILTGADVAPLLPALTAELGSSLLDALQELWREAIELADVDADGLLDVARRWLIALDVPVDADPDSTGTRLPAVAGCTGHAGDDAPSDSGDGDGSAEPDAEPGSESTGGPGNDPLGEAVEQALGRAAADAERECRPDTAADETDSDSSAESDAARDLERHDRARADHAARTVFTGSGHGYGSDHANPISGTRPPDSSEFIAVNTLTEALRRARFRERAVLTVPSAVPPGRLIGRDAMLSTAQRELGHLVTANPFRQRIRRHTEQPPLTIGIAVDVSGSMGWAEQLLASTAWIVANATHRAGGRSATVAFGAAVTPIVRPGRPPANVTEFSATDGFESFVEATCALDGILNLAAGGGARILVAVTDGHLVGPGQIEEGTRLVTRLAQSGVAVLHVTRAGQSTRALAGATLIELGADERALDVIATAAATALASR